MFHVFKAQLTQSKKTKKDPKSDKPPPPLCRGNCGGPVTLLIVSLSNNNY